MGGQVLVDTTWVSNVSLAKGTRREDIPPELVDLVGSHMWVDQDERANIDETTGEALTGLKDTVWIDGVSYAKGSIPPADVIPKVGTHMWVQGFAPIVEDVAVPSPAEDAPPDSEIPPTPTSEEVVTGDGSSGDPDAPETDAGAAASPEAAEKFPVPNRGGRNSSAAAWLAYARDNNVEVDDDAERHEIIAALEAADVPTE